MKHTPTQELPQAEPVNFDATWGEDFERQQKRSKAAKLGWITRRARQRMPLHLVGREPGWYDCTCTPTGRRSLMTQQPLSPRLRAMFEALLDDMTKPAA